VGAWRGKRTLSAEARDSVRLPTGGLTRALDMWFVPGPYPRECTNRTPRAKRVLFGYAGGLFFVTTGFGCVHDVQRA